MLRGIYAAASAMIAETVRQDTISNNLANASTPGFKRDLARFQSFPQMLLSASDQTSSPIGSVSFGSVPAGTHVDLARGTIHTTGNPMDVAIKGEGYFVVETPNGNAYTREGALMRGEGRYLSTAKGHPLTGLSGRVMQIGRAHV